MCGGEVFVGLELEIELQLLMCCAAIARRRARRLLCVRWCGGGCVERQWELELLRVGVQ